MNRSTKLLLLAVVVPAVVAKDHLRVSEANEFQEDLQRLLERLDTLEAEVEKQTTLNQEQAAAIQSLQEELKDHARARKLQEEEVEECYPKLRSFQGQPRCDFDNVVRFQNRTFFNEEASFRDDASFERNVEFTKRADCMPVYHRHSQQCVLGDNFTHNGGDITYNHSDVWFSRANAHFEDSHVEHKGDLGKLTSRVDTLIRGPEHPHDPIEFTVSGQVDVSFEQTEKMEVHTPTLFSRDVQISSDHDPSLFVEGELEVDGHTDLDGNLDVRGKSKLRGDVKAEKKLDVKRDVDIKGTLEVDKKTYLYDHVYAYDGATVRGSDSDEDLLTVEGSALVTENVEVVGHASAGSLQVNEDANIAQSLDVGNLITGATTVVDKVETSDLDVTGTATVNALEVGDTATIGGNLEANGNRVNINGNLFLTTNSVARVDNIGYNYAVDCSAPDADPRCSNYPLG